MPPPAHRQGQQRATAKSRHGHRRVHKAEPDRRLVEEGKRNEHKRQAVERRTPSGAATTCAIRHDNPRECERDPNKDAGSGVELARVGQGPQQECACENEQRPAGEGDACAHVGHVQGSSRRHRDRARGGGGQLGGDGVTADGTGLERLEPVQARFDSLEPAREVFECLLDRGRILVHFDAPVTRVARRCRFTS